MKQLIALAACTLAACATPVARPRTTPYVDYHEHLVSAAFQPFVQLPPRDGAELVRRLDAAGIARAVVLSVAYTYGDERKPIKEEDRDRMTREENDWTSAQVVANAPRLIGFCSANPLREAALAEIDRCLSLPRMKGIKLHFGNSGVSLRNPAHLGRIAQVFALAERRRVPVLVHMRARGGADYGAEDARIFVDKLIPQAPDVDIIVAHLGGGGSYPAQVDEVMGAFAEAFQAADPRTARLYFDLAGVVEPDTSAADAASIARRIREVGASHVLYGSDTSPPGGTIAAGWQIFRSKVPISRAEIQTIADNRLEFIR